MSVTNSPVTYDGTAKSATVSGSVAGSVSNILTGGAATQTNAGTYAVTAELHAHGYDQLQQPDRSVCRQLRHQQGHTHAVGNQFAGYL